ncbi:MAG: Bpu10I family restriction endonuclease [Candidatus Marinimicrobia bacterium]|nr:Bpu10I family restriction endonuclease [Candidatus Neomarinimicrobiota bacterium]MCF7850139.1 Bpu10I family restriction endonuclease [Candidatus Neomarinimicrobiota bacterium]
MDKPQPVRYDLVKAILPTPHFDKLTALLNNPRLPTSDKAKVEIAIEKYNEWIAKMDVNHPGNRVHVDELVRVTNEYKKYIELDLIFDSEHDFLYRQKGQIKLDNSILEEFLPHLFIKALTLPKGEYEVGPRKTFAGLRFNSSISTAQSNLQTSVRLKDQDFILGTNLFISTSVNENFEDAEIVETYIGYVCAECKTNLDKTMFQEAVATSRDLKMAVPSSLYFLVCDYLDMTPQSITNTHIDEVLILRKSKRLSASIRQKYRTTADRANNRDEYVSFIDSSQYSPDVFLRMIDKTQTLIDQSDPSTEDVIAEGHF